MKTLGGRIAFLVASSSILVLQLAAQLPGSQNVRLLGTYQGHKERNAQGTYYSSVWGYTDVNGREYGILGCYRGTAIVAMPIETQISVDAKLADSLLEVAFIPGPPATYSYREFKTYLTYLYIVSEGGSGVQIVDLSSLPNSVRILGNYQTQTFDHAHTISETSGYLYVNGGNSTSGGKDQGGTSILSLANPEIPVRVGQFSDHYVHDAYTRRDTLFASGIYGVGLSIIDVRDKTKPVLLKTIQYPGLGTHNSWTSDDGKYVMTTDEIGSTPKTLKVWDIRDLNTISKAGEWNPQPADIIHNVCIKGNFAYTAFYKAGLQIADISDPRNPTTAGFYDTYPDVNSLFYDGAWGVYPYLPSGKILIGDMQTGLWVFQFDSQKIGKVSGIVTDAFTHQPVTGAIIRIQETGQTRWTNASGRYLWGYAVGTFNATVERQGYQPQSATLSVVQNATTTIDVSIIPMTPPPTFELFQNYPNPFNPKTTIQFDLANQSTVSLKLFDVLGRVVRVLKEGTLPASRYSVVVDAADLSSGVYLYRLQTPEYVRSQRMIVTK